MSNVKNIVEVKQIRDGKVIQSEKVGNITCNTGMSRMMGMVIGQVTPSMSPGVFNYIAVGTGSITPSATITALQTEVLRLQSVSAGITQTVFVNDTASINSEFIFTTAYTLTEAGLLDASPGNGGDLLGYILLNGGTGYSVNPGDQLTIVWNVVIAG